MSNRSPAAALLAVLSGFSCHHEAHEPLAQRSAPVLSSATVPSASASSIAAPGATDRREALMLSTPEWKARAAEVASEPSPLGNARPALGLACDADAEPPKCRGGDPACRVRCDAVRVCDGCAGGRWVTLEVGVARGVLFVSDEDPRSPTYTELLPYGEWRNRFRLLAGAQHAPLYRALADETQRFPDYRPGSGEFGYGNPTAVTRAGAPEVRAALESGGLTLVRLERYGASQFPVFVTNGRPSAPHQKFHAWAAAFVRAVGLRACELVTPTERYQFDRFAAENDEGGVYVLVAGAFHPWLAPRD